MRAFIHTGAGPRVLFGSGVIAVLEEELLKLGCRRVLLVSTSGQMTAISRIANQIKGLAVNVFPEARMHTPIEVTEKAIRLSRDFRADCTISFGGGSAIGLGKAIALRTDLIQVAVPTTHSGSEMTPIVGETVDHTKTTQRSPKVLPELVLYDPELAVSVPPLVAAGSGFNAIAHGVEGLYQAADVRVLAEEGIEALVGSLKRIVRNPKDVEARSDALYGSWLCGRSLASATMALHHKLCHILGGAFDLPHAPMHALLLPHTVAYNAGSTGIEIQRLSCAVGASDPAAKLYELLRELGLPYSLQQIGMREEDLDSAVNLVMRSVHWNHRSLDKDSILAMLKRSFTGSPPQLDV